MKSIKSLFVAVITITCMNVFLVNSVAAQETGIKRTELQRYDLSTKGKEARQVRIDFAEGKAFGMHAHPGEEIIYVIEGSFEYEVQGKPPVTLKAGDVLFVPAGVFHAAKNVGRGNAAELATYIVEKDKPLLVLASQLP